MFPTISFLSLKSTLAPPSPPQSIFQRGKRSFVADFMLDCNNYILCHKSKIINNSDDGRKKCKEDLRSSINLRCLCTLAVVLHEEKFGLQASFSVSSIPGFAYQI